MARGKRHGASVATHQDGRATHRQTSTTEPSVTPSETLSGLSLSAEPPPTKRPRLKLNVRARRPHEVEGDTIAVSRPRREPKARRRYSQDADRKDSAEVKMKPPPKQQVPVAPSKLSSFSSNPASPRENPLSEDPTPPASAREEYGDFMSYYILGGDDEEVKEKEQSKVEAKARSKRHSKSNLETLKPHKKATTPLAPDYTQATTQLAHQQLPSIEASQTAPTHQQAPSPQVRSAPSQAPGPQNYHLPPPHPPGPAFPVPSGPHPGQTGHHAPHPQMQRGPTRPLPQPIIQIIDIKLDSRSSTPDSHAVMIRKVEELSSALANFGGVPDITATPPSETGQAKVPVKEGPPRSSNPLDGFLSFFGGDDEEEEMSEVNDAFDYIVANPGIPDVPLTHGIQFIQNALKSWAQQRMTHQVTLQWNQQQAEHFQRMQTQKRGPGRPRQYDIGNPVQPVIQMSLADTPEGVAIKAFQSVLDSGCLHINTVLPADLARALRYLYIQIDHLINQNSRSDIPWQCMSYGAQIQAHKFRVEKWREAQVKHQEEMARQQQLAQQQMMSQMGMQMHPGETMTPEQLQHQHAMELERKRSMQHAAQQPYNATQHLNPLQFGPWPPGVVIGQASSLPHNTPITGAASSAPPAYSPSTTEGAEVRPRSMGGAPRGRRGRKSEARPRSTSEDPGRQLGLKQENLSGSTKIRVRAHSPRDSTVERGRSDLDAESIKAPEISASNTAKAGSDTIMNLAPTPQDHARAVVPKANSTPPNYRSPVLTCSESDTSPETIHVAAKRCLPSSSSLEDGTALAPAAPSFPYAGVVVEDH